MLFHHNENSAGLNSFLREEWLPALGPGVPISFQHPLAHYLLLAAVGHSKSPLCAAHRQLV